MGKCLFVTGTGTDVGKTYVTGLIVKALKEANYHAGYYKTALSGAVPDNDGSLIAGDAKYVADMAGLNLANAPTQVSYVYEDAVSPHLAAKISKEPVDLAKINQDFQQARAYYDLLTIEGSGGIVCPLRWDNYSKLMLTDVIKTLGLSVLVVAVAGLGTINATVLTIEYLRQMSIPIAGIILNNYHDDNLMELDNRLMIAELTHVPVLATVSPNSTELTMDINNLVNLYQ